ncbi:MAG: class I SAM-dependent methyltransferase, partial [Candidatus Korobacteraceae bacterium]
MNAEDKLREEFNQWAEDGRGDQMEAHHFSTAEQAVRLMDLKPGERVLDLGCGTGWASRLLARLVGEGPAGFGQVVAVDLSDEMIRRGRAASREFDNILFVWGSAQQIPWEENYFDKVLSVESFYFFPDQDRALAELFRVMAPRARMFLQVGVYKDNPHSLRWLEGLKVPVHVRSEAEYVQLLKAHAFEDVETRRIPDESPVSQELQEEWQGSLEDLHDFKRIGTLLITARKPDVRSMGPAWQVYLNLRCHRLRGNRMKAFNRTVLACAGLVMLAVAASLARAQRPGANSAGAPQSRVAASPPWMASAQKKLEGELTAKHTEAHSARIQRGMRQVAQFWRTSDGNQATFEDFVRSNFAADSATLDQVFLRWESNLEQLDGHMLEITREFREQTDLDRGPILPVDEVFAAYDPSAHVLEDFFGNRLAFTVLLNFPITVLEERLSAGERWTRREWAETKLAERFSKRVPAQAQLAVARASARAEQYIAEYNIWMHHVLAEDGRRLFPSGMRLLSHWNLRDQIKADYAIYEQGGEAARDAQARQRVIQRVMDRIVTQTIPRSVVDNPQVDWNPFTNEVRLAAVKDSDHAPRHWEGEQRQASLSAAEGSTRYE